MERWKGTTMNKDKIREQVLSIRKSGTTNMFDTVMVQRLAYEQDFFDLVNYIEEDKAGYSHLIITGEFE